MKTLIQFAAVAALSVGVLAACGDDETTAAGPTGTPTTTSANGGSGGGGTGGATTSNGGSGGAGVTGFPAPPELGNPIDRMGRPAINTVGSKTFSAMADAAKDAYNVNHDEATWVSKHADDIAASLAILDALDKPDNIDPKVAGCGNQAAAGVLTDAMAYGTLAGVLANDRLRVDASSGICGVYLGVELNATGLLLNSTCGGRTPADDVVDTSYSALAGGLSLFKNGAPLFGDGVKIEPELTASYAAGFPFLAKKN